MKASLPDNYVDNSFTKLTLFAVPDVPISAH